MSADDARQGKPQVRPPGAPPPRRPPPAVAVAVAPPPPPPPAPRAETPTPVSKPVSASSSGQYVAQTPLPTDRGKVCPTCFGRYPGDFNVCPKDATKLEVAKEDADPLLGATLGGTYQIKRVLGEGGMGKVYEASHLRLGSRRFAVKVLHAEYARHQDVLSRFQREAEAAASIAHSHVLEVFDVARTEDNRPYIVGEFLEGHDFHEHLEQHGKLDLASAVSITRQVAGALGAAHAAGIVHRDLKPENIYVLRDRAVVGRSGGPFVKILDFGISKVAGKDTALTRTGMIMGTPNYMAPEQARGEKVDHRVDIYALGAILYRALTGKRAFEGTDAGAVITAVLNDEPRRPRDIEPSIPEAMEVVIQRAMAKDARDRYQSMREFDADLAVFDVHGTPSMPPPPPGVTIAPVVGGAAASDVHARTFIGNANAPVSGTAVVERRNTDRRKEHDELAARGRDASLARPTIVVLTPIAAAWILFLVTAAVAGAIRAISGRDVTESEVALMTIFSLVAGLTPLIIWIYHVVKNIWRNSVRAMELAGDMRRSFAGSIGAYGAIALAIRFVYTVPLRDSRGLTAGWADLVLLFVALLGGAFAGGIGPLARLRRRLLNT